MCRYQRQQSAKKCSKKHTSLIKTLVKPAVPDRPPSTLMLLPPSSSPCSISFGLRLLFIGSGGARSPPICNCRLARPGLGFTVGGLLKRLTGVPSAVPLMGRSPCSFSFLLNLFTILLTFPSERLMMLPVSPTGAELDCDDGFGGISGLGLASGLRSKGDVARWDASWMDMVTGM